MNGHAHRNPLLSLVVFSLINVLLLSIQVRNEEGRVLLRSWGLSMTSPVATASHYLVNSVKDLTSRYFFLVDAARQNRLLREENQRLQLQLYQVQEQQQLFDRSREFELLRDQYHFEWLPAAVIGRNAPFAANRLVINAGTQHGVVKDAAVFTPRGILGRVLATSAYSSEVELLTNATAAAGAVVIGSRLQGIVQGDGSHILSLNFIANSETVEEGQYVFTAGNDRVYPKGLPIGEIVSSVKGTMYYEIEIHPFINPARIEEVLVVTSN